MQEKYKQDGRQLKYYINKLVIKRSLATWVQTLSASNRCFLEQETLHRLLSTGYRNRFESVSIRSRGIILALDARDPGFKFCMSSRFFKH